MHSLYKMPNPTIRVSGEIDGQEVVMEATARSVSVESNHDYQEVQIDDFLDSSAIFRTASTTTLSAELQDGWVVTLKDKPTYEVARTARTEASDRTVEALEKARRACGAPEKAKVSVGDSQYLNSHRELTIENASLGATNLDEPNPISVEFRWMEEVHE